MSETPSDTPVRMIGATNLALGVALGIVGVLGYGLLFANERDPGPGAARAADTNADSAELVSVLRDLERVLTSLEGTLQRAEMPAPQVQRTPARAAAAAVTPSAEPALAQSLAEIASALRTLQAANSRASAAAVPGSASLVPPAWIDRRTAFDSQALKAAKQSEDETVWDAAYSAYSEKHRLWSQQEVLSAYGKPDQIWISEKGPSWSYSIVTPGEGEEEFNFRFHDGLVYSTAYDFDTE